MNDENPMIAAAKRAMVDRKFRRSMTERERAEIDVYFAQHNYFQPRPISMVPPERSDILEAVGRFVMGGML